MCDWSMWLSFSGMTAHVSFVNVSEAVGWDTGVRCCGLVDRQVVEVTGLLAKPGLLVLPLTN